MNLSIQTLNTDLVRHRLTVIAAVAAGCLLAISLIVFALNPQWVKRVVFFPQANAHAYAAELRYLPESGSAAGDIRSLLEDILLGPSNFGNDPVLPPATRLESAMLEDHILYVGFSRGIFATGKGNAEPREMLQAVADAVYFNFPWLDRIHFFINGRELSDARALRHVDRKFDLARSLVPLAADLRLVTRQAARHPFFSTDAFSWDVYTFENGAVWDERILK
jgi:hypothetical protein